MPTDGSDCAEAAVEPAIQIADNHDATLHVLHVVESTPSKRNRAPVLDVRLEETDSEKIRETATRAEEEGLDDIETGIAHGYPFVEIVHYVETRPVDLVVMATQGRMGINRLVNKSTTECVIRRSSVPVLAVPHEDEASADAGLVSEFL